MHRIPHSKLLKALLGVAAWLTLLGARADAQDKSTVVPVPVNGSHILEMSKQQRINQIDNKDSNVARVEFVPGSEFRKVMIYGNATGLSRLTLVDDKGTKETFEIVVEVSTEYLRRVLSQAAPSANIQIVQGTNGTLILTGTVQMAAEIEVIMRTAIGVVGDPARVINALRIGGVQQVQLDVVIARVSRSATRKAGLSFIGDGVNGFLSSTIGGGGDVTSSVGDGAASLLGTPALALGILRDSSSFMAFLDCLRTENLAKVIAQPKVCTLSGQPAEFISGGEQAVPTLASGAAGGGAVSGVEFKPFGTTVRFLPIVKGGGKIYLEVEPQFTFPDPNPLFASGPVGSRTFGRSTQRVKTAAFLEAGQTLAIGGMVFHQANGTTRKIPVLGDLPYIGTCFSHVEYTNSEEDLLILITPRLVDAMACNQLPPYVPGEETRKPDDYELFLERILEAPRGPREVWQCDKYVPAYKNSPTVGMYGCSTIDGTRGVCDLGGNVLNNFGTAPVLNSAPIYNQIAQPTTGTGPAPKPSPAQPPAVLVRPMTPPKLPAVAPKVDQPSGLRSQYPQPAQLSPDSVLSVQTVPVISTPTVMPAVQTVPVTSRTLEAPPAGPSGRSSGVTLIGPTPLDPR